MVLVGLPTAFGIFPEMSRWPFAVRVAVAAAWIGVAVTTVVLGTRREERLDQLLTATARQRRQLRDLATEEILSALLRRGTRTIPRRYLLVVYLYDPELDELYPVFPDPRRGADDERVFKPGAGAAGFAFANRKLIVVTGDAVSDETYGLTPAQQSRFTEFRAVVATPVSPDGEQPVGVLSAISRTDDGYFADAPGQANLRELADIVGVVLVDVSGVE